MQFISFNKDFNTALKFWSNLLGDAIVVQAYFLVEHERTNDATYVVMASMYNSTIANIHQKLECLYDEMGA
jgi:hypothetical protein